jgi:mannose-6-phosphate isomerase-like protein (cupin superfamily)
MRRGGRDPGSADWLHAAHPPLIHWLHQQKGRFQMTTAKAAELHFSSDQYRGEWQQVTPGERFRIRVSSAQTMGAYSVLEIVADPGNGVPLHIHNREEEHFIVVEGTLDIASGDRRWDAHAGTSVTVRRGVPHAWCNPSNTPLRMLVVFSPGQIEGLFRTAAGVDDVDKITAIAARYGTKLVGPPLQGTVHSIHSPQK